MAMYHAWLDIAAFLLYINSYSDIRALLKFLRFRPPERRNIQRQNNGIIVQQEHSGFPPFQNHRASQ